MGAGEASSWFDEKVIDGTVNGANATDAATNKRAANHAMMTTTIAAIA